MNNIRVKQESLNNWREEFSINEEIEGGISVQNVADGLNFTEIETVDIIKPEPIKGSSDIEEGVGKVIRQVVKSPGVRRFVSNLSKSSKVKIVSPKPVITPGSTLGSKGKFAANHFDKVPTGAGSSYVPKHVRYLDDMMDKSKRGLTGTAGAKGFPTPDSKSVKVYKQPSYANPKYPGDKTGAYARELARQDNTARIGKNSSINKDGISNKGYYNPDGKNTVGGKVKLKKLNDSYNWQLEMAVESLISEGYNDNEIVTILTEELPKIPLGPILTGAVRGAWNLSTKGVKGAYDLGKGVRGVVNRGVRDTKLTKDILSTAKKLRNPDNVSITKSPRVDTPSKGGRLVKSFKGFMQNVKDAGSNLANRTKGKLDRINAKKAEIQTTAKDVDVLGGAATTPKPTSTPMKNITPSPIGDGIKKVANQIKTGASAAAVTGGVVAGSKLTGGSSSKVSTATPTPPVEKKVEAPITNDGKKEVNPSKNEKIESQPTKRELRNKRNDALSSKEGRRARRDASLQKKKDSGFPLRRMKSGTPVNQLFNKEEVTNEDLTDFKNRSEITTKGKLNKGNFSASIKQLTDKEISDKLPTIGGVKLEMDADGKLPNMGKFVKDQAVSQANQFADSGIIDNNPEVAAAMSKKVGLEGPMTTDKFKDITKQGTKNLDFDINKNIQGTQANRLQNVANSINQSTSNNKPIIKNPKIKTVVQGSSSTRPMGEGIVDTVKNLLKLGKNPKHKVSDETPMGKAVTGLQKRSEANKKAMELLNHYSWRDELDLQEMGAYRGGGTIIDPSGSRNKFGYPDSLKPGSGPTKEVPLTPSQNRMLVKKKTKTTKVG